MAVKTPNELRPPHVIDVFFGNTHHSCSKRSLRITHRTGQPSIESVSFIRMQSSIHCGWCSAGHKTPRITSYKGKALPFDDRRSKHLGIKMLSAQRSGCKLHNITMAFFEENGRKLVDHKVKVTTESGRRYHQVLRICSSGNHHQPQEHSSKFHLFSLLPGWLLH